MPEQYEYAVDGVAKYVAASLTKAARETGWPDNAAGNAAGLLVQDLGEFAEAMVACGVAGYWSPTKAFERLYLERIEVLMGAVADPKVGRRYLDSLLTDPKGLDGDRPGKKSRPEDALDTYLRSIGTDPDVVEGMRQAWLKIKGTSSEWFVHPTGMGPMLSQSIRSNPGEAEEAWSTLLQTMVGGCYWTIVACAALGVTTVPDIVRAIYGVGACLAERDDEIGLQLLELHGELASKVAWTEREYTQHASSSPAN